VLDDPATRRLRRLAGEVLARRIARRVVEARVEHPARRVLLDVEQFPGPRRGLCGRLDVLEALVEPAAERARLAGALEQEAGSALHAVVDDGRLHAAGRVQQLHPAVVARDQRALGRGQRDVELALRVLAVDQQRACDADRHLRDPDELLDVAGQHLRIERVARDVLQRGSGLLAQELLAHPGGLARVVVLRVARDGHSVFGDGHDLLLPLGVRTLPSEQRLDLLAGSARPWRAG
jgi:hypothetical protein